MVETEGVEPSSDLEAIIVSTSVVCDYSLILLTNKNEAGLI